MRSMFLVMLLAGCSEYELSSMVDPEVATEVEATEPPPEPDTLPEPDRPDEVVELEPGEVALTTTLAVEVADVSLILDTTGSMGPMMTTMASEFRQLAVDLDAALPDTTFGVATFDDYAQQPFGERGDSPFRLLTQQTDDLDVVQDVLSGLPLHSGGDLEESALEALYQAASGAGYDMDCDGVRHPTADVQPFRSDPSDVFGGTEPGAEDPTVSGTGTLGGMGFRHRALPVLVYATDAPLRNPDIHDTPGGCVEATPAVAGAALRGLGAKVIGIHVDHVFSFRSAFALSQMDDLAVATNSLADFGDGPEAAVVSWKPSTGGQAFRDMLVDAIGRLVGELSFDEVRIEVVSDPAGVYLGSVPEVLPGAVSGDVLELVVQVDGTLGVEGQPKAEPLVLALVGDETVQLSEHTLWVVPNP